MFVEKCVQLQAYNLLAERSVRFWPVPDSYNTTVPTAGQPGSYWENRGDRRHAGVDIFAPAGAAVFAIEGGIVHAVGPFTTPEINSYWNGTMEILIKTSSDRYYRYAELEKVFIEEGEIVESGQKIGLVGCVLNPAGLTPEAPAYIRNMVTTNNLSMLHIEMYSDLESITKTYLGGNFFVETRPAGLIDPTPILNSIWMEQKES